MTYKNYKLIFAKALTAFTFFLSPLPAADWTLYSVDGVFNNLLEITIPGIALNNTIGLPNPVSVAVSPDGTIGYVLNQLPGDTGSVSIIDLVTNTVLVNIPTQIPADVVPFSISVSPDGTKIYMGARGDVSGASDIYLLEMDAVSFVISSYYISSGEVSTGLAISPNGQRAYITRNNSVVEFDLVGHTILTTTPVFGRTTKIAITADGLFLYVTDMINNNLFQIEVASKIVTTFPLAVNSQPENIAISADGLWVYVASTNSIVTSFLNRQTNTINTLALLDTQTGVSISPDSQTVYYGGSSNQSIMDSIVNFPFSLDAVPIGNFPSYSVISPDQAPTAAFSVTPGVQGTPSTFDGSLSTSPVGSIASYFWDYGDGVTETTLIPNASHTYTGFGNFNVTLTVTNTGGTSTTQTYTGQVVSNNGGPSAQLIQAINILPVAVVINPPTITEAKRIKNIFLTQTEYADVIRWIPSNFGITPVAYRVYQDAGLTILLEQLPARASNKYVGHGKTKNGISTYYIVAVGQFGNESLPVMVTIP